MPVVASGLTWNYFWSLPSVLRNSKNHQYYYFDLGVVGMITPWNFPNAMITRKVKLSLSNLDLYLCKFNLK